MVDNYACLCSNLDHPLESLPDWVVFATEYHHAAAAWVSFFLSFASLLQLNIFLRLESSVPVMNRLTSIHSSVAQLQSIHHLSLLWFWRKTLLG